MSNPPRYACAKNKIFMITRSQTNQMELTLQAPACRSARRLHKHLPPDAQWWFRQMRLAVNCAIEWQPDRTQPRQAQFALK